MGDTNRVADMYRTERERCVVQRALSLLEHGYSVTQQYASKLCELGEVGDDDLHAVWKRAGTPGAVRRWVLATE